MTVKEFATKHADAQVRFHTSRGLGKLGYVVGYHEDADKVLVVTDDPADDEYRYYPNDKTCTWITKFSFSSYKALRIDQMYVMQGNPPTSGTEKKISDFPHRCPKCASPAFVGIVPSNVSCSNRECAYADVKLAPLIVPDWGYTSFPNSTD